MFATIINGVVGALLFCKRLKANYGDWHPLILRKALPKYDISFQTLSLLGFRTFVLAVLATRVCVKLDLSLIQSIAALNLTSG